MHLSKPAPRKHIHTRSIECQGYKRDDGLWDIEGRITDTKTYSFANRDRDGIQAGEPVHDMLIRVTLDDDMVVKAAEAKTASGPYTICGDINAAFAGIAGLRIGPGWRKAVTAVMGGAKGCTHLRDLLMGPVAVTAFQTIYPMKAHEKNESATESGVPVPGKKPMLLDTCYALRASGPVAERRWPEFFTPEKDDDAAAN
ncbi:MAG: DUF2889 domain-containing protein [Rhodospirillaceae bacterium]